MALLPKGDRLGQQLVGPQVDHPARVHRPAGRMPPQAAQGGRPRIGVREILSNLIRILRDLPGVALPE